MPGPLLYVRIPAETDEITKSDLPLSRKAECDSRKIAYFLYSEIGIWDSSDAGLLRGPRPHEFPHHFTMECKQHVADDTEHEEIEPHHDQQDGEDGERNAGDPPDIERNSPIIPK
jgi:hypothetical protein